MHVSYCCIAHPLQPGVVKTVFKKTGHKADWGQIVNSHFLRLYYVLSKDKFI